MRVIGLTVLLGLVLVSPASAAAQSDQSYSAPLFSKLFAPSTPLLKPSAPAQQPDERTSGAMQLLARPGARVVCGMSMVPVDPAFDPRIRRPVPSGKTFTIKRIKPPICGQ